MKDKKIKQITKKLQDILETDSGEKVMVFTQDKSLQELSGQINLLLADRQKMKADYHRQEQYMKKMLSNISHDIKTPLTVILGYLEIMRLQGAQEESLEKVEAKAQQVMDLVNAFFTLAKLEAGDIKMELKKVSVNELCREAVLSFYDLLAQKKYEVDIDIPKQPIYVQGNEDAIQRILYNLLSNAVRYGSDGKYIGLTLSKENGKVMVAVTDKGKGIEKTFAATVFERLYTMEDSRNRNMQGNGLGLPIAKSLAEQMGGEIVLQSEPGVKTTFTVILEERNS